MSERPQTTSTMRAVLGLTPRAPCGKLLAGKRMMTSSTQKGEDEMSETEGVPTTAVAKKKEHDVFREALVARRDEFAAALAGRMDVDHFIETAMTAYFANPDLAKKCSAVSLFGAFRRSAQLKLRPDGVEATITPYRGEAQFQPMFQGIVRTMLRTRTVRKIEAHVVKTGDVFEYELGLDPRLRHVPAQSDRRGETTHVYAVIWLANGERQFEVMDRVALDAIQKEAERQRGGKSTPAWDRHPDEMRRKIVVKRLAKYVEGDPEQAAVIAYDNAIEMGHDVDPGDLLPEAEWRTVDQRARDHAKRQTDEMRLAMERMSNGTTSSSENEDDVGSELVGFGKYRDLTWGELYNTQRGYLSHFVLTEQCTALDKFTKARVGEWYAALSADDNIEEAEVIPDPDELEAMRGRGSAALVKLRKAGEITDDEMAEHGADLGMLAEDGDWHGLVDAVDALERAVATATGDLFGGAS